MTAAHQTDGLAELVCSNSFRSDDAESNAVGLLHQEMRDFGFADDAAAEVAKVPAGSALAVDRDVFSAEVAKHLRDMAMSRSCANEWTLSRRWAGDYRDGAADRDEPCRKYHGAKPAKPPCVFRRHCPDCLS